MEKVIAYIKGRGVGYWLMLGASIAILLFAILYPLNGTNEFVVSLSSSLIAISWISFALALLSLVFEFRLLRGCVYLLTLYSLIAFIGTQANYLANVLVSIDGNSFSGDFIFVLFFGLIGFLTSLISLFFTPTKSLLKKRKSNKEEEKDVKSTL